MDSSPILVDSCGILTFLQECEGHQEVLIWEKVAKGPGIFESSKILVPKVDHLPVFEGSRWQIRIAEGAASLFDDGCWLPGGTELNFNVRLERNKDINASSY